MEEFEKVVRLHRPEAGLEGVIVIHSTLLGPGAGGCRLWQYDGDEARLRDAKRLAQGMSYKSALAGLPLGGAKAVLERPRGRFDRARFFRAFGEEVERLGGSYVTAEDVGTTVDDMSEVGYATRHVAGLPVRGNRIGGDPSPHTARGVFEAMQAAVRMRLGGGLEGVTIGVQGLGNVGRALCELLAQAGARLIVADINAKHVAWAERFLKAKPADPDKILASKVDVLAPCALGPAFDWRNVAQVRAAIICGAANNQLAAPENGDNLARAGVTYVPDYVANAGGIINVAGEYLRWDDSAVEARITAIGDRVRVILGEARSSGMAPNRVADAMARRLVAARDLAVVA
ncbi:MAG: Glu/Leu/Phe/Val dehydrogenase dimerization domain-containing protein [Sphingomonas sp.]